MPKERVTKGRAKAGRGRTDEMGKAKMEGAKMAKAEEKEKVAGKAEHGSHEVAALRGLLRCLTCDGGRCIGHCFHVELFRHLLQHAAVFLL
eukprot:g13460.t1